MNTERRTISDNTYKFIECIEQLNNVHKMTSAALANIWGDNYAEKMIDGDFCTKFDELKDKIASFLSDSVLASIGNTTKHEI
jgi:hypothetical protein